MKLTTKDLTLCAVLTAMALALSYLEGLFPLSAAIPIPGIKLGLANVVTLFALYVLGPGLAMLVLLARCFLGGICREHERADLLPAGRRGRHGGDGRAFPAETAVGLWGIRRRVQLPIAAARWRRRC